MKLRDELDGLSMLVTLLDSVLFTPTSEQAKEKGGVVKEGAEESRDNANSPKREEPAEGIKVTKIILHYCRPTVILHVWEV